MNDKEILDKVYRQLKESDDPQGFFYNWRNGITDFIEKEWQRRDEEEMANQYNRNRPAKDHIDICGDPYQHDGNGFAKPKNDKTFGGMDEEGKIWF